MYIASKFPKKEKIIILHQLYHPLVLVVAVDSWARSRGRRRPPGEEVEQKRLVLLRELLLSRVGARSTAGVRLRRRNEYSTVVTWIHGFYGPARGQLWRDDEDEDEEEEEKEVRADLE
ncbi:unnamed protein product [Musa acuminata var. zebrina]